MQAKAAAVGHSQAATLAVLASNVASGVNAAAAPTLNAFKRELAQATDAVMACQPAAVTAVSANRSLENFFKKAAPGIVEAASADDDKPVKGVFGNDVAVSVKEFAGPPRVLGVEIDTSAPCGSDGQLLVYEQRGGTWTRALRWTADFQPKEGDAASPWGDFFLYEMLADAAQPEGWKMVVAHGTPWCTSRFSGFGLAVVAASRASVIEDAQVVWKTSRGLSRGDYGARLKATGDTFELRVHDDEMAFRDDANAYERLVVYRYRVSGGGVTRLEPVAANARGFVEEWLSMPWEEAKDQISGNVEALRHVHGAGSFKEVEEAYTAWAVGAVRACREPGSFQIEVTSQTESTKSESKPGPQVAHFLHARQTGNGYAMTGVAAVADPQCAGPDLMAKPNRTR